MGSLQFLGKKLFIQNDMFFRYTILLMALGVTLEILPCAHGASKPTTNVPPPKSTNVEAEADLQQAQMVEQNAGTTNSLDAYRRVAKKHKATSQGADAQLRLAELQYQAGDLERAFKSYNVFVAEYPGSKRFEEAVKAQIEIANAYLDGRKLKFLGIPLISGYEKSEKMYSTIIGTAPFSKYAPLAQFNLGLAYERMGKMQDAIKGYQVVLDRYPASAVCPNALYQIGYCYMRIGTVQGSQDLSALIQAKNTFEDFLMQFPKSEKVPQAKENLLSLQSQETGDYFGIAAFYDRSKEYRSAFVYYNEVIRRDPTSKNATAAKDRIEALRSEHGDENLRTGPEQVDNGERVAQRRRLQAKIESPALADYDGPPRSDIIKEDLPVVRPRLRTQSRDVSPLPPVEPMLPTP